MEVSSFFFFAFDGEDDGLELVDYGLAAAAAADEDDVLWFPFTNKLLL